MTTHSPSPLTNAPSLQPISTEQYRRRLAAVQQHLTQSGRDGLLCLDLHDVVYLTGFVHSPSERPLGLFVPATGEPTLLVPLLEREHAEETFVTQVETYEEYPGEVPPVRWMVDACGARRLAVDALDARTADALRAAGIDLVLSDVVERLRWVKSPGELDLVRAAARFADRCLEHVLTGAGAIAARGGSELDILRMALEATAADMAAALGDRFAGTTTRVVGTVHTGPRAALPHGRTGARVPGRGDVLIAGIGVAVGNYHAESGATFTFGAPDDDQLHCLRTAAACDAAAVSTCRPGVTGRDVNAAAMAVLTGAGLAPFIRHRIGHGMGVQGHESPWLAPGGDTPLAPGMVFSNEPGIYRPGVDGYRTISTMIVGDHGASVPNRFGAEHPVEARVLSL
jgi:Xaa-Pro dipeptidase